MVNMAYQGTFEDKLKGYDLLLREYKQLEKENTGLKDRIAEAFKNYNSRIDVTSISDSDIKYITSLILKSESKLVEVSK